MQLVVLAAVYGCGQRKVNEFQALTFPDVMPPAMMEDPMDRAEYVAMNMWNLLLDPSRTYPSDSSFVSGVRIGDVEQKFANWADILNVIDNGTASKAVSALYDKVLSCEARDTSSMLFETFTSFVEKYLFDPNSPLRNEDLYAVYASRLEKNEALSDEMRQKYGQDVSLCTLNRVGTKAADFRFADKRGQIRTLYGIKAPYTLLFFSNPGCKACMDIINVLKDEPRMAGLISSGLLAVLNIYIDEDIAAWRSYMPVYPEEWYNGFDPDFIIRSEALYNVRAIPSLYLLDADKSVIMKDAPEQRVFDFLWNLGQ